MSENQQYKNEQVKVKETTRDGADREAHEQFEAKNPKEFNRAGELAENGGAPVKGERVLEYREKIDKERIDVIKQPMQAEEIVVQKQKLALQKDGHKEKVASFKTPEEPKMTASGHAARQKVLDETSIKHVGPTEKVADVIKTDGVSGERVQVFKKPIEKEHTEVYKEDLEQEKVVVAKQPLAMKPVGSGRAKVAEVLETDDMATGAHQIAASNTKVKHKGKLEKTLDILSTENEKGEQQPLDGETAEKVLGHNKPHAKKPHKSDKQRDRSDSSSSSSSSSDNESKKRPHHHHKKHGNKPHAAAATATDKDETIVAAAVAKDNSNRDEVKVHVEEIRPMHG